MFTTYEDSSSLAPPSGSPAAAALEDVEDVLSLDIEENDFLYRIRRNSRVVYVRVLDGDIIPPDYRTDGYRVLSKLRTLPKWNDDWNTLTVQKSYEGVECIPNKFRSHGLDLGQLNNSCMPFFNLLELTTVARISYRVFRVRCRNDTCVLKIARFKFKIAFLQNEVSIYHALKEANFAFAPRFIGFVYEESIDRTIGFLIEDITGTTPTIQDLESCMTSLHLLHESGIIHGDTNKYNFLMTDHGAKIFDFEVSVVQKPANPEGAAEELEGLAARLEDQSGVGRR